MSIGTALETIPEKNNRKNIKLKNRRYQEYLDSGHTQRSNSEEEIASNSYTFLPILKPPKKPQKITLDRLLNDEKMIRNMADHNL